MDNRNTQPCSFWGVWFCCLGKGCVSYCVPHYQLWRYTESSLPRCLFLCCTRTRHMLFADVKVSRKLSAYLLLYFCCGESYPLYFHIEYFQSVSFSFTLCSRSRAENVSGFYLRLSLHSGIMAMFIFRFIAQWGVPKTVISAVICNQPVHRHRLWLLASLLIE